MIGTIKNANKGRLSANFYVDRWPGFSAVVGELIWPRRSDINSMFVILHIFIYFLPRVYEEEYGTLYTQYT